MVVVVVPDRDGGETGFRSRWAARPRALTHDPAPTLGGVSADPHVFVVLGGTGDLAGRKLIPALHHVAPEDGCPIVGVGTRDHDQASYRAWAVERLREAGAEGDLDTWVERLHYHQIGRGGFDLDGLAKHVGELEAEHDLPGNRVFYLALPPQLFEDAIEGIDAAGLADAAGWARLVIEKPFGTDTESAAHLDEVVHRCFDESSVFRIDHFLGKETVRNLLAFRFANPIFETTWNRDRIERVEVTVAEPLGVDGRAGYYDRAGVVRDMIQNHLTQVLSLIAMEPPIRFDADAIRDEKVKVLRAIEGVERVVWGRYTAGEIDGESVPGYLDEDGVPDDSTTATFVEATVRIDNWRWQGVPFTVRTGKRLPSRTSTVDIQFQRPPVHLFHELDEQSDPTGNLLTITLQPDEGFDLCFEVKQPGNGMDLERMSLGFRYGDAFEPLPDAYETLVADVLEGDQTLFVRSDEVAESWRIWDPVADPSGDLVEYPAGSWPETS